MISQLINGALSEYQRLKHYPHAIFRIVVDGQNISSLIASRLISMTITDNRGMVADSVDISLDDADGLLEIPPIGAELEVWLGWDDTGLVHKGKFKVSSTSHSGSPDSLRISAVSNDLAEGLRQKRERAFKDKTLQDIFTSIGVDYDLKTVVHESLAKRVIKYLAQNESDANLITRIADEHDAVATVKNNHLILLPKGLGETVSGLVLPMVELTRNLGDQHSYDCGSTNDKVEGVKAYYYNANKSEKLSVTVGSAQENPKEIRFVHRDKKTAELAALAEFNRCKRSEQSLSFTLAKGRADLIPEQQFTFVGIKPQIDDIVWLGKNVTHELNDSTGFTTKIQLEVQLPNADDIAELFEDKTKLETPESAKKTGKRKAKDYKDYTGVVVFYKDGSKTAKLTSGDQSKPLKLTHVYKTKKTAENALKREQEKINKVKKTK